MQSFTIPSLADQLVRSNHSELARQIERCAGPDDLEDFALRLRDEQSEYHLILGPVDVRVYRGVWRDNELDVRNADVVEIAVVRGAYSPSV